MLGEIYKKTLQFFTHSVELVVYANSLKMIKQKCFLRQVELEKKYSYFDLIGGFEFAKPLKF